MNTPLFRVRCITIVSVVVTVTVFSRAADRPITVCEALTNINEHRDKIVAVRAVLLGGYHSEFLKDSESDEPCDGVKKKGYVGPPAIAITQYTESSDVEGGPVTFESKTEEIKSALAEARKRVKADPSLAIVATFTGQLRARKDVRILRNPEGWYYGSGYGQNGQYPALLVLMTVRDVNVVRKDNILPNER